MAYAPTQDDLGARFSGSLAGDIRTCTATMGETVFTPNIRATLLDARLFIPQCEGDYFSV